jgi:predicted  nucleic acid-binding Zn-ribbon protein
MNKKNDDNKGFDLEIRMALVENTVISINQTLERLDKRFDRLENSIDYRFNKVDEKLDKLNSRIDKLNSRIDRLYHWLMSIQISIIVALAGYMAKLYFK